jgi:hypothetical protein
MPDTPLQSEDTDSLSLFPAEPVPPPAATEIDALIDAVSVGECRFPSERQSTASHAIARPSTSGARQQLATMLLLRPAVMRWVVPSAVAFGVGAMAVLWGLRVLQPVAPSEIVKPAEPAVVTETAAPRPPVPTNVVPPLVALRPGPPVMTGLPIAALKQWKQIPVRPPVPAPARDERRVATATPPSVRPSTAIAALREVPTRPAPVATTGSADVRATTGNGTTLPVPSPLPAITGSAQPLADIVARASSRTPAFSGEATASRSTPAMAEEDAVRETLGDYEEAVEGLDVGATAEVWPSVDRRALSRVFAALKSQGLEFASCDVSVAATTATARCSGTLEFVRKVGSDAPMMLQQEWLFKMRKYGTEWKIQEVTASQASPLATQRTRGQH